MKKFLALLLSVVLVFSLCAPAFASCAVSDIPERPFANSFFYETGDYTIHYRVFEAENAQGQIFMIHGFALSSYCFEKLALELQAAGYTCVTADLPDFGYSTRETANMEKLPREDIMHSLMTSLSSEPWYVAAHSMGGYIALKLAEKYPESVKNLLLYGTAGNDGIGESARKLMGNPVFAAVMGKFMEAAGKMTALVRILLIIALNDKEYAMHYDISKVTDPFGIKGTGAGACYSFSMLPDTNYEAVKNMPPILLMNGDADKVLTDDTRVNLRAALPEGSTDSVIPGGGHLFIENMAKETAAATLDFLAANP